ncbi:MAG: DNA-binding protein WhiA [Ruminococcus sp.]|nr:DNA-binding protein WhiA [Ruminococcus sp.]
MSFSDDVRQELCTCINDKNKHFVCLYGMILFSHTFTDSRICFQSKSKVAADTFRSLFEKVFCENIPCCELTDKNNKTMYIYNISDERMIEKISDKYHLSDNLHHINYNIIPTNSLCTFLAGIFLSCGSVNDPKKEYHLEFTVYKKELAEELVLLLKEIGVTAKLTLRRKQYIVYIKGSESIEDTLTFIGAQQCTLNLMNVKINKDFRNKANRIANCDNANIEKIVEASMKQIADILLISKTRGLSSLPDDLKEVAEIRLNGAEMSLQDIGESLTFPISRSGVNHRMRRIAKIAHEIRESESDNYEK